MVRSVARELGGELKLTSRARAALHPEFSVQQLDQPGANGQAESGPSELSSVRDVGLRERFENQLLLFWWNPDSSVPYREAQSYAGSAGGFQSDPYGHFATLCELDRVPHQVDQNLPHAMRVANQVVRYLRRDFAVQLEVLLAGCRGKGLYRDTQNVARLQQEAVDVQGAGLDVRKIQNVIDDGEQ